MSNYELGPTFVAVAAMETVAADALSGTTGCTDAAVTLSLDAVDDFPDSGIVKIEDEYILYLEKDDALDTLKQCVRGLFGTTAAAHAGAIEVSYYASGLGKTVNGVRITVNESSQDLHTDQDGETPVETRVTGTVVKAEISLADIKIENFALAYKVTATGTSPARTVAVIPNVGYSLQTNAKMIHFFPYVGGSIDTNLEHQYTIPSGGVVAETDLVFDASTQRAIKMTYTAFPDASNHLLIVGKHL